MIFYIAYNNETHEVKRRRKQPSKALLAALADGRASIFRVNTDKNRAWQLREDGTRGGRTSMKELRHELGDDFATLRKDSNLVRLEPNDTPDDKPDTFIED
jgi:hypothetical protein